MLVDYGIQNEQSDLRCHVSVCNATVYVFTTKSGQRAIQDHPEIAGRPAFQDGVNGATAYGYPMPIRHIRGITSIKIPQYLFMDANFLQSDTTTQKGNKAVHIIKEMLKKNLIPFNFDVTEITDRTMQIKGMDILVSAKYKIQVKCDWRAGETRNVYLQTAERNPLKRI